MLTRVGNTGGLTAVLRSVAGVAIGTLLVGVLGDQIAGYYADVRDASKLKDDFTTQVASLTSSEADTLQILAEDLEPNSFLAQRCRVVPVALPEQLQPSTQICRDAIVQSILEEQQAFLDVRRTHLEGQVLQRRLKSSLQDERAAGEYATLLIGLESLRKLNSSTTCGTDRNQRAEELRRAYAWVNDATVTQLVGPSGSFPCDWHGPGYPEAAAQVAQGLAFESDVVGVAIRDSLVNDRTDSRYELLQEIFTDPLLLLLLMVGVPGALLLIRRKPSS